MSPSQLHGDLSRSLEGRLPEASRKVERVRCPRVVLHAAPGRLGYQSPGITTGAGGASLDWDRRRRVTPVQTASQEAWPEAEPLGWNNSLRREPRWNADKRARSERARAASQDAAVGTLRLPAFRFLHFLRLIGRNRN